MRIIAGQFRGRKLLGPADDATRPVTDRVKQRIFDWLAPRLEGEVVCDVFAGTGSFGLEALSRGSTRAIFFEKHRPAVDRLRRNIATLAVEADTRIETGDVFRRTTELWQTLPRATVIFFDPPYKLITDQDPQIPRLLQSLGDRLVDGGVISVRHDTRDTVAVPATLAVERVRAYGSMTITLLSQPQ